MKTIANLIGNLHAMRLANAPSAEDRDLIVSMWTGVLRALPYEQVEAAVWAYLADPETSRWWPQPGQLLAIARRLGSYAAQAGETVLDADSAYAAAREYYARRGCAWLAAGPYLRDARARAGLTLDQVEAAGVRWCEAHGMADRLTRRSLRAAEEGWARLLRHEQAMLIETYGDRTLAEDLSAPDPWYDLGRVLPVVADAARRATPWAGWAELTSDGVPAHRRAYRDCYSALLAAGASAATRITARPEALPRWLPAPEDLEPPWLLDVSPSSVPARGRSRP